MKNFKNLTVWQDSHELVLSVYKVTKTFPKEAVYGITSQLRRAVASIPAILQKVVRNILTETLTDISK